MPLAIDATVPERWPQCRVGLDTKQCFVSARERDQVRTGTIGDRKPTV